MWRELRRAVQRGLVAAPVVALLAGVLAAVVAREYVAQFMIVSAIAAVAVSVVASASGARLDARHHRGADERDGTWTPPEGLRDFVVEISDSVVPALLDGEDPVLGVLRRQFENAEVASVDLDGSGFFVHYAVGVELPAESLPDIVGGHVTVHVEGCEYPGEAFLFVSDGYLDMLEYWNYGLEEWPRELRSFEMRDIEPLLELHHWCAEPAD